MRTDIRISTVKSKNSGGISHPSDPGGQELRLKGREIGSGLIRGMGETAATSKIAVELGFRFLR
jgi:hypothetical protein